MSCDGQQALGVRTCERFSVRACARAHVCVCVCVCVCVEERERESERACAQACVFVFGMTFTWPRTSRPWLFHLLPFSSQFFCFFSHHLNVLARGSPTALFSTWQGLERFTTALIHEGHERE
jgi:hypothetical protein